MSNAQQWLDENYPLARRAEITKLYISNKYLVGSLDLTSFPSLVKLDCSYNNLATLDLPICPNLVMLNCSWNGLTNLDLANCPNLVDLNCSHNKLTEFNLPNSARLQSLICSRNQFITLTITNQPALTKLDCDGNSQLTTLAVTNSPQLQELEFSKCSLTNLELTNNPTLTELGCSSNQLTNLSFLTSLASASLTTLILGDNHFSSDLNPFGSFINLKHLNLSYNLKITGTLTPLANLSKLQRLTISHTSLSGSLQYLQRCGKLRELWINNTNIITGLEYLTESIEKIDCANCPLEKNYQLTNYRVIDSEEKNKEGKKQTYYDLKAWRNDQPYYSIAKYLLSQNNELNKQVNQLNNEINASINTTNGNTLVGNAINRDLNIHNYYLTLDSLVKNEKRQKLSEEKIAMIEEKVAELTNNSSEKEEKLTKLQEELAQEKAHKKRLEEENLQLKKDLLACRKEICKSLQQKEQELTQIKANCLTNSSYTNKKRLEDKLNRLLITEEKLTLNPHNEDASDWKEDLYEWLTEDAHLTKSFLNELGQKQTDITILKSIIIKQDQWLSLQSQEEKQKLIARVEINN